MSNFPAFLYKISEYSFSSFNLCYTLKYLTFKNPFKSEKYEPFEKGSSTGFAIEKSTNFEKFTFEKFT